MIIGKRSKARLTLTRLALANSFGPTCRLPRCCVAKGVQRSTIGEPIGAASHRRRSFVDRLQKVGERGGGVVDGPANENEKRSGTMSDEGRDRFEIPKEMRSMAQASFDQARKAFEKFLASAQQTAGSIEERGATVRAGAKDISTKAISNAEKNVQASLDFGQSLLHAKELSE